MVARQGRNDRIEVRISTEEKQLLVEAAARERLDLSAFIMRAAIPAARDVIARADRIVLTERETEQFLDLLEHPPEPTEALIAAARRHLERK